jgi:trimethylamine--corrinoid protein Co-methyltransferase
MSDAALDRIEDAAYRLLGEVGISLRPESAVEMLRGLGCRIARDRTLIPRGVVQWALDHVTAHRENLNPDGSPGFTLGDGCVRFHNGGGQPFALDLNTGQERPATLQDVADVSRLLDALPGVDQLTPLFAPQDVPSELIFVEATAAMLRNTRKPVSAAAIDQPQHAPYLIELAAACCGGPDAFRARPTMSIGVSPVSPLRFTRQVTSAIVAVAGSGAPFHPLPAPSMGATGPVTMAGVLAQQHAEVLASLVIAAAARPGVPVVYCSRISPIDLRTAVSSWGGPEVGMSGGYAALLASRLGLPCDSYGFGTSSPSLDPQFAYERLANALVPALAGVDILSGVGMGGGLVGGYEIAVIDDELISLIRHIVAGHEVSDETLAYEVMQAVVPRDGVFLGEMHTVQEMRRGALWIPELGVRGGSQGGDTVVARARAKAREILSTHEVEPLPDAVNRQLEEILEKARRELLAS